jgi:hypothetical protein
MKTMAYTCPIKFTVTDQYGCGPDDDDVYTVEEFRRRCLDHGFIDYDGFGYAVKNSLADITVIICPSRVDEIPADATHIVWFNK